MASLPPVLDELLTPDQKAHLDAVGGLNAVLGARGRDAEAGTRRRQRSMLGQQGGLGGSPQIQRPQSETIGMPGDGYEAAPGLHNALRARASSGGSATTGTTGTTLSTDATSGENASIRVPTTSFDTPSGLYYAIFLAEFNQAIENLDEGFEIGYTTTASQDPDDAAMFRPQAGDKTSGNVRVDHGGTDEDVSIDYPTLNGETHFFAVVLDYNQGETRFYVDEHPLVGVADATISHTPDLQRAVAAKIFSNQSDSNEQVTIRSIYAGFTP